MPDKDPTPRTSEQTTEKQQRVAEAAAAAALASQLPLTGGDAKIALQQSLERRW